jgi:hypothetical protein
MTGAIRFEEMFEQLVLPRQKDRAVSQRTSSIYFPGQKFHLEHDYLREVASMTLAKDPRIVLLGVHS